MSSSDSVSDHLEPLLHLQLLILISNRLDHLGHHHAPYSHQQRHQKVLRCCQSSISLPHRLPHLTNHADDDDCNCAISQSERAHFAGKLKTTMTTKRMMTGMKTKVSIEEKSFRSLPPPSADHAWRQPIIWREAMVQPY